MEIAGKDALLTEINDSLMSALGGLVAEEILPAVEMPPFTSGPCRDPSRGDYTSNCAMAAAASANMSADVIARELVSRISLDGSCFSKCASSGGYINFTLSPRWYCSVIEGVLRRDGCFAPASVKDIPQNLSDADCEAANKSLFDVVSLPQRIRALLDSLSDYGVDSNKASRSFNVTLAALLSTNEEKLLIKHLIMYPEAAKSGTYTLLMSYCGRLSMLYGSFANACPVRNTPPDIMNARVALCTAVYNIASAAVSSLKLDTKQNERN